MPLKALKHIDEIKEMIQQAIILTAITIQCAFCGQAITGPTETPVESPASERQTAPSLQIPLKPTCEPDRIWPQLTEVQPAQVAPGAKVKVFGSGGYMRCGASHNESARAFQLFFDDQPIAQLSCYVNHCEQEFTLPIDALPGAHTLSVEGGSSLPIQIILASPPLN